MNFNAFFFSPVLSPIPLGEWVRGSEFWWVHSAPIICVSSHCSAGEQGTGHPHCVTAGSVQSRIKFASYPPTFFCAMKHVLISSMWKAAPPAWKSIWLYDFKGLCWKTWTFQRILLFHKHEPSQNFLLFPSYLTDFMWFWCLPVYRCAHFQLKKLQLKGAHAAKGSVHGSSNFDIFESLWSFLSFDIKCI